MLVAATSVEEACVLSLQFERTARMQLIAMSAGEIKPIKPELGREAHDWILRPRRSQIGFEYYARKALSRHPDVLR
jgi:L-fuculose-phosphate aldolase